MTRMRHGDQAGSILELQLGKLERLLSDANRQLSRARHALEEVDDAHAEVCPEGGPVGCEVCVVLRAYFGRP